MTVHSIKSLGAKMSPEHVRQKDTPIVIRTWKRLKERLSAQGLSRTILYLFFTVLMERLGVHFYVVFRYCGSYGPYKCTHQAFEVIRSVEDFSESDCKHIEEYGGITFLQTLAEFLRRGESCAIWRQDGELACMCWLIPIQGYANVTTESAVQIGKCFTLASHRGKGLYPRILRNACEYSQTTCQSGPLDIFIESSMFNYASIRGILKAGFEQVGIIIKVGRWKRFFR